MRFHPRLLPNSRLHRPLASLALAAWMLFPPHLPTAAAAERLRHDHIISVDADARTIVVTNMSLHKPITLKIDKLMTVILIDKKKATLEELKPEMPVAYVIGVSGIASRIDVEHPAPKSVFRH